MALQLQRNPPKNCWFIFTEVVVIGYLEYEKRKKEKQKQIMNKKLIQYLQNLIWECNA